MDLQQVSVHRRPSSGLKEIVLRGGFYDRPRATVLLADGSEEEITAAKDESAETFRARVRRWAASHLASFVIYGGL